MPVFPSAALDVVQAFLRFTMDAPDEKAARGCLSKSSLAEGGFQMPDAAGKGTYVVGEPFWEGENIFVPVTLTDTASGMKMTMPLAPVMEEGAWKLDMAKMMQKLMGGAVSQMAEQMGEVMGKAMEGIGEAMSAAFGGETATKKAALATEDAEKLQKRVAEMTRELDQRHDLEIVLDVDAGSLFSGEDEAANKRLLGTLEDDVFRNLVYAISEAHRQFPLAGRVKALRLEGAADASEKRNVFSEGARIIYRLDLADTSAGIFNGQELMELLKGVAAGMDESPPPLPVENRPSYRPGFDAAKTVKDYREFVEPVLMRRISKMLNNEVTLQIDWDMLGSDIAGSTALWTWGLNRICGAIGLLLAKADVRAVLAEAIGSIRWMTIPHASMKSVEFNQHELWVYISPGEGEAGAFYETEIAEKISEKLKLTSKPRILELEKYAKTREASLKELFGVEIKYAFDWDGFTCMDEGKNAFALSQIREMGIDATHYAITNLAEKNPNFKQQFPQRIRWIYLEHAPSAEKKIINGEQTTIRVRMFLHQGYDGYHTIKDLEKALPAIVAGMPDLGPEAPPEPTENEAAELKELQEMAARDGALVSLRNEFEPVLTRFANSIGSYFGGVRPIEILWASLEGTGDEARDFLRLATGVVTGALSHLSNDAWMANAFCAMVDKVVIEQADCEEGDQWTIESRVLNRGIFVEEGYPIPTPGEVYDELRELFGAPPPEEMTATPIAPEPTPPAPTKSPAKKPAPKKAAKPKIAKKPTKAPKKKKK